MARLAHGPPFAAVVFDCDSTLSTIEGIEELTAGHPEIAALTSKAMEGLVPLEEVYGKRLELAGPVASDMGRIAERYQATALAGAAELVAALHHLGKRVEIVSGGLLPAVRAFGVQLGVPADRIHAVDLSFNDLEAREACARFIAFTAVERRPEVAAGADVEVDRADLAALLPHLVSAAEVEALQGAPGGRFDGLLARALGGEA